MGSETKIKMPPTQWLPTILTLVSFFLLSLALPSHGSSQVGYGYVVRSAAVDSNQKVLTATLDLIKPSSVYAPDVQTLNLHVRSYNNLLSLSLSNLSTERN